MKEKRKGAAVTMKGAPAQKNEVKRGKSSCRSLLSRLNKEEMGAKHGGSSVAFAPKESLRRGRSNGTNKKRGHSVTATIYENVQKSERGVRVPNG